MNENQKFLDTLQNQCDNIREVADSLSSLAGIFCRIGNTKIGDELADYSDILHKAQKEMESGYTEVIAQRVKEANEFTGTMLQAISVGMEMNKVGGKT